MSKPTPPDDLPFLPLTVPRLKPEKEPPAEPVNWFTRIAPRLPEPPKSVHAFEPAPPDSKAPRAVAFRDVDEVAALERVLANQPTPEPPDVAEMREQACAAAEEVVRQAMAQAERIQEEARAAGYQAGYAQGFSQGEAEARRVVTQRADAERVAFREDIAAFIAHVEAERRGIWEMFEPQMVGLVFDLAKQVIKQEIEVNRDVSLSVVRNALRRVADSGSLRIRVHDEDLETVRANREELLTLVDGIPHVEIVADRRVGLGGCIVETASGNIDARIDTQLDMVAETLKQMVVPHDRAA